MRGAPALTILGDGASKRLRPGDPLAAISHNLTRASGAVAGTHCARVRAARPSPRPVNKSEDLGQSSFMSGL